jgi:hypothetical protein
MEHPQQYYNCSSSVIDCQHGHCNAIGNIQLIGFRLKRRVNQSMISSYVIGACQCNSGWTGRGEFIDLSGRICNINDTVLLCLHIIGAVIALRVVFIMWRIIYQIYVSVRAKAARHYHNEVVAGGSIPLMMLLYHTFRRPAAQIALGSAIFGPTTMIYHILRFSIGNGSELYASWYTTVLTMITWTPFWIGCPYFPYMLAKHTVSLSTLLFIIFVLCLTTCSS